MTDMEMAADGQEIDLYADDLGEEFNQENEYNDHDLYDEGIAPRGSHDDDQYIGSHDNGNGPHHQSNDSAGIGGGGDGTPMKKISVYVGNLSWWTTDQDVIDAITDLGINDIFEVKFFENRANGQSKGFCVVTLGSDVSVRGVIEKLPKGEIHGQKPMVTSCNRQNLNHFEMQSRKATPGIGSAPQHLSGPQNPQNFPGGGRGSNFGGPGPGPGPGGMRPPLIQRPQQRPNGPLIPGQPRMPMPPGGMQFGPGQPQWGPGMPPSGPPRPVAPMHPGGPPMPNMAMIRMNPQGQRGPINQQPLLRGPSSQDPRSQLPPGAGPMPDWGNEHPPHGHGPPQNSLGMPPQGQPQVNQSMPQRPPGPVPGMPPVPVSHPGGGHPAPHVNPAFFQAQHHQVVPQNSVNDPYGNRMAPPNVQFGHPEYGRGPQVMDGSVIAPQISESEFEDIINKNKTVCSSAINRAVSDASSGEYPTAIETLVTAISLIKQSKVANDERCKILVTSLQDTLQGIEAKSYGSSRSKDRPRSRERSRDRGRRDKRRDRSRSRERDYRDRSRERDRYHDDRYHDDRYRDKDRDRERDHRSSRH